MADDTDVEFNNRPPNLSTWVTRDHWAERIICFNASWFTVSMGTGVIIQVLNNFPYPAEWLHNLSYCFWVLTMLLFLFFIVLFITRAVLYPGLMRAIFQDFYQTSYLGAIPITVDTILVGISIFYNDREAAIWAAYALYWLAVAMSVVVGCIIVFITCAYQEAPELRSITGVWLLSFIPFIVTAAAGSVLAPYLNTINQMTILVVSFLLWSLGVCMSLVITTIYFWRLVRHKLPIRDTIVSCFIPMGPTGMGAYAIQNLAVGLSHYVRTQSFILHREPPAEASRAVVIAAVSECIDWVGLIVALMLVAFSTFWFIEATAAVIVVMPKRFNVGFWAFVFPVGVYSNALCALVNNLNNDGFRGWAATCVVITVLLWLGCAVGTLYKGVWCGKLFFAPGLEGWNERKALREASVVSRPAAEFHEYANQRETVNTPGHSATSMGTTMESAGDSELLDGVLITRTSQADGTYSMSRFRKGAEGV